MDINKKKAKQELKLRMSDVRSKDCKKQERYKRKEFRSEIREFRNGGEGKYRKYSCELES